MDKVREDSDLTLKDIILNIRKWIVFLLSKWKIYAICMVVGIIAAICVSKFSTKHYIAESNFVHENASGASSDAGSLFTQLGFGANSNAGLFTSNDNILWLYTSSSLIREALLEEIEVNGKRILLGNYFTGFAEEIKKVRKQFPELASVQFVKDHNQFSPEQNRLMRHCVTFIKKNYLEVTSVNQTDNIVNVRTNARDELFSYYFNVKLTEIVNKFYISTKTEQLTNTIQSLTYKADSVRKLLDKSMYQAAAAIDYVPYLNPAHQKLRVESQKKGVDVEMNSAIYMQLVQNIETTKLSLAQQMPIIRVVDQPVLPLPTQSISIIIALAVAIFLSVVIPTLIFIGRRIYLEAVSE